MKQSTVLLILALLTTAPLCAQTGQWSVDEKDFPSILIVGTNGGPLSGAYRVTNTGEHKVKICLNACKSCPKKSETLGAKNSIDLFVSSCLRLEKSDAATSGTYQNLSPVSAP
ncbi:MAG: hypothetical protein ABSE22_05950 [Xanthobacteraceae bacterium]|jgi:hypothetical protein